jgi:outer membrane protein
LYDASKHAQSIQLREKAAGADVQFAGEQQQLILRVSQAYFKVLAAEDRLSSYQAQVDAAEQQRRGAQARFDAGRARITDVREAEPAATRVKHSASAPRPSWPMPVPIFPN